jgi:hypothetical protein
MKPLGSGIFAWSADERHSGRYGAFFLSPSNLDETEHHPVQLDLTTLSTLNGLHVRITLRIRASRPCGHVGDFALHLAPGPPPEPGTLIELGVGRLFLLDHGDFPRDAHPTGVGIGLAPSDGRDRLWLNPVVLYRLHDQSVELFVQPTSDAETPPSPLLNIPAEDGLYVGPDGTSVQILGIPLAEAQALMILPEIAHKAASQHSMVPRSNRSVP